MESENKNSVYKHVVAEPEFDESGKFPGYSDCACDISEHTDLERQLVYVATHDDLTGVFNRREFRNRLEHVYAYVQDTDFEFSLCLLSLDRFKLVNDTAGHTAGDELLNQLAKLLDGHLYEGEVLGRMGGDEFGLILEVAVPDAHQRANEIIESISEYEFVWDSCRYSVGACVGITSVKRGEYQLKELIDRADSACYAAKAKGRNQSVVFVPDSEDYLAYRAELKQVEIIKEALEANRFRLWMQPIESDQPIAESSSYEVLLRLQSVQGDLLSPHSFIPVAERYQIMQDLDWWVLQRCLESLPRFLEVGENISLSINLSGNTLSDKSALDRIVKYLGANSQHNGQLCFEINETAAITNIDNLLGFMADVKALGCKFALDDFGAGLSSFGYIRSMPIDYLKIDGYFIRNIRGDATNRAIVEAFVKLSESLGIKTVAECVEDKATRKTVFDIGIDYVQGYGVARPLDLDQTLARLIARSERKCA